MKFFNLGNRVVNNYLISTEVGYVLVDTFALQTVNKCSNFIQIL